MSLTESDLRLLTAQHPEQASALDFWFSEINYGAAAMRHWIKHNKSGSIYSSGESNIVFPRKLAFIQNMLSVIPLWMSKELFLRLFHILYMTEALIWSCWRIQSIKLTWLPMNWSLNGTHYSVQVPQQARCHDTISRMMAYWAFTRSCHFYRDYLGFLRSDRDSTSQLLHEGRSAHRSGLIRWAIYTHTLSNSPAHEHHIVVRLAAYHGTEQLGSLAWLGVRVQQNNFIDRPNDVIVCINGQVKPSNLHHQRVRKAQYLSAKHSRCSAWHAWEWLIPVIQTY